MTRDYSKSRAMSLGRIWYNLSSSQNASWSMKVTSCLGPDVKPILWSRMRNEVRLDLRRATLSGDNIWLFCRQHCLQRHNRRQYWLDTADSEVTYLHTQSIHTERWARKLPLSTPTEIFDCICRSWLILMFAARYSSSISYYCSFI